MKPRETPQLPLDLNPPSYFFDAEALLVETDFYRDVLLPRDVVLIFTPRKEKERPHGKP